MSPYATCAPLENSPLNYLWYVHVSLAPYPGPIFQMYFRSAKQRGKTAFLDQQATISFLQLNIQLAFNIVRNIAGSWSTVYPPGLPDPFLPSLLVGWLPVFTGACGYSPPGTEFCVSLCSTQPISPA